MSLGGRRGMRCAVCLGKGPKNSLGVHYVEYVLQHTKLLGPGVVLELSAGPILCTKWLEAQRYSAGAAGFAMPQSLPLS
eukprot:8228598-Ditylum_brightwellii.AAC.1